MSATADYRAWPRPVRTMAVAIDSSVTAASAGAADAFDEAVAVLRRMDTDTLGALLGEVTRDLLERSHPDGLDSDDAEAVIASGARTAAWFEPFDPDALVLVVTGALGVLDLDESPVPATALVTHGVLLIAERLAALGLELASVLDAALVELRRAQTVELP